MSSKPAAAQGVRPTSSSHRRYGSCRDGLASQPEPARTTDYLYDAFNRLVEVKDGAGARIARYAYDPADRRLLKQTAAGATYYLPSPAGLLAEADASGTVSALYGWRPEHWPGTAPLYVKLPRAGSAMVYAYAHTDELGTPRRLTDKTGELLWSAEYDAFGRAQPTVQAVVNRLRLPGQYGDAETGLHYNDRRYYDPETGRYLTRDPIGLGGGSNLYAYVGHDPIDWFDPTGENPAYLACLLGCTALGSGISALNRFFMPASPFESGLY